MKTVTIEVPDNYVWNNEKKNFEIINDFVNTENSVNYIFSKLPHAKDENEAYILCSGLVRKCFKLSTQYGDCYIKIYSIKKIDGYITAEVNRAGRAGGRCTFSEEKRYVFTCKKDSEFLLWKKGTHSPRSTAEDYEKMAEISDECFKSSVKQVFDEYYNNEIAEC